MIAILDVSGAMQILLKTEKFHTFNKAVQEASAVLTPDLFVPELTNTLWKFCIKGIYTAEECLQFIKDGLDYISEFIDSKKLWQEAFREGVKNKHPVYDMYYAIAARRNSGTLITNDGDLATICKKLSIEYIF
jgi:predicted nucleic acid-binding protein